MSQYKILFVDDEENIINALRRALFDSDYDVHSVLSGPDGLKLLDQQEFAVIISDYRMPEMNGAEFLRLAHEKAPDTTRILLTGYGNMDVVQDAVNKGHIYSFLQKPWEDSNLLMILQQGVEYYEMKQEKTQLLQQIHEQNEQLQEYNERLEEKLDARTKQVRKTNQELKQKILELEARDRVLQFMLEVHPFEDSLEKILNEIVVVAPVDSAAVYVLNTAQSELVPAVGVLRTEHGIQKVRAGELDHLPDIPKPAGLTANLQFQEGIAEGEYINTYTACIPLGNTQSVFGLLLLLNRESKEAIPEHTVLTAGGFATLLAIVINEHLLMNSSEKIDAAIQDILTDLK